MIIDSHAHLTGQLGVGSFGIMAFSNSIEVCLAAMDRVGCDYVIQQSCIGLSARTDFTGYAEVSIAAYEKSGKRILTNFYYDPRQPEAGLSIMEKYHTHPAFVGIKIHPSTHGVSADDARYRPVWEAARQYSLPIMSHTWALTSNPVQVLSVPEKFEKYLKDYPDVPFVFGHSGGRVSGIRTAAALGQKYKNTYFDLAGDVYDYGLIEYLTETVGADRILLASDAYWFDLAVPMGMVLGADISTEAKKQILGENAARLYGIEAR